jgi:pimeloyl-ACP methyl ester carboxylesterase
MASLTITSVLIIGAVVLLSACTQVGPYHTTSSPRVSGLPDGIDEQHRFDHVNPGQANEYQLGFVEFDEFGHLFNRKQMEDVLRQVNDNEKHDPIVLVFVHGWHHNAYPEDDNVQHFRGILADVSAAENHLTDVSKRRPVIGIYVGWRGESIGSNTSPMVKTLTTPLRTATFWDRKNTAQAIGHGGVAELFSRLSAIRDKNDKSRLVIIGHSFGGAFTYSALSQIMIDRLSQPQNRFRSKEGAAIRPFGDLVVLVNPAFEAMQYRPLFDLSMSREYATVQRPIMTIITTEADSATRSAFWWGRFFSTMFDTYADDQGAALNKTAVGHYIPYITHTLTPVTQCDAEGNEPPMAASMMLKKSLMKLSSGFREPTQSSHCFNLKTPGHENDAILMLMRCDAPGKCSKDLVGDHYIPRGPVADGLAPFHNPFLNIRTTSAVMSGHTDIWNDNLQSFLRQFVLLSITNPEAIPALE